MKKYNFHDDFKGINKINLKTDSKLVMGLVNTITRWQARLVKTPNHIEEKDYTIKGYNDSPLKVKVIRPKNQTNKLPALLFVHGGGFIVDVSESHLKSCYKYAETVNCVVVMPYYRLAPEYPFPAAFDDNYKALLWMNNHAEELDIDTEKMGITGDSCGACLAASVTQKCRDENGPQLIFQSLVYPVTDNTSALPSMDKFEDAPVWKKKHNIIMWEQYLNGHTTPPKYAVPLAENLANLPPAYIEVCEVDCLRDEGLAYAEKLKAAGVPTEVNDIAQGCHGFMVVFNSEISKNALAKRINVFKRFFE